jgi:hypothetical protein
LKIRRVPETRRVWPPRRLGQISSSIYMYMRPLSV